MSQKLYYLALPYSGTEQQQAQRSALSLKIAAEFLHQGIHVFAPVNYVNTIAEQLPPSSLEARKETIMSYLYSFLKISKGLILLKTDGWQTSWGVQQELIYCRENQIPVYEMDPGQASEDLLNILLSPIDENELDQMLTAA